MNGASQFFWGQYASQKLLPNQILSYFDVISYCEKKLGTHVSNFFEGVERIYLIKDNCISLHVQ